MPEIKDLGLLPGDSAKLRIAKFHSLEEDHHLRIISSIEDLIKVTDVELIKHFRRGPALRIRRQMAKNFILPDNRSLVTDVWLLTGLGISDRIVDHLSKTNHHLVDLDQMTSEQIATIPLLTSDPKQLQLEADRIKIAVKELKNIIQQEKDRVQPASH